MARRLGLGIILMAATSGCFSREPIRLTSEDPGSKIPAIRRAVRQQDVEASGQLVKDLESDDPAVRFYAIRGLRSLVGEDFGYLYYQDETGRQPSIEKWKSWLSTVGAPQLAGDGAAN
jgi:hypothetical protein